MENKFPGRPVHTVAVFIETTGRCIAQIQAAAVSHKAVPVIMTAVYCKNIPFLPETLKFPCVIIRNAHRFFEAAAPVLFRIQHIIFIGMGTVGTYRPFCLLIRLLQQPVIFRHGNMLEYNPRNQSAMFLLKGISSALIPEYLPGIQRLVSAPGSVSPGIHEINRHNGLRFFKIPDSDGKSPLLRPMKDFLSAAVQPVHTSGNVPVNLHLFVIGHPALFVMVSKGYRKGDSPADDRLHDPVNGFFHLPGFFTEFFAVSL